MARSFSVSGTGTVKTGTYGNPKNAGYIKVTGATFDESTGKIGINYEYGVYQTTAGKSALVAAVAVAFGGSFTGSCNTSNEIQKIGTSTTIAYRETPESDYTYVKSDDIIVARDYSLRK